MRLRAPAGLILGVVAWVADQHLTSELADARCDTVSPDFILAVGAACAGIAAIGALLSWTASRGRRRGSSLASFTALVGIAAGAFSFLVVTVGTVAGYMMPECF